MKEDKIIKIKARHLFFSYGDNAVLQDVNLDVKEGAVTAVTGPSGQGKSTLLALFNRLWEDIPGASMRGIVRIHLNGREQDIYHPSCPLPELRRKVGMVFQIPNPLPMSISKNVAFPLKVAGRTNKGENQNAIEDALKKAFLWGEVKDRLNDDARGLSGGQQQRLCVARALVVNPEVLLLDEPTSSLDEAATLIIESLICDLKHTCTIVMVSHDMRQVERVADSWVEMKKGTIAPQPA